MENKVIHLFERLNEPSELAIHKGITRGTITHDFICKYIHKVNHIYNELLDYAIKLEEGKGRTINDLQQRLNVVNEMNVANYNKYCEALNDYVQERNKNRKALEYVENNLLYEEEYDYDCDDELYLSSVNDDKATDDLRKILTGENND